MSTKYQSYSCLMFREFLKQEKLTDNLIHFVLHSIAMVRIDATASEGLQQTKKFLSSLGKFYLTILILNGMVVDF